MKLLSLATFALGVVGVAANSLGFEYVDEYTQIGDHVYHSLRSEPKQGKKYKGTALLIHGWPDMAYGWHSQIDLLTSLGYRVIAPNMLGYGRSSRPEALEPYTQRNVANDLVKLLHTFIDDDEKAVIVGHDWGAAMVWQTVVRHPGHFKAIINLAVPYFTPWPEYADLADQIKAGQRQFQGYMLQFREPGIEKKVQQPEKFRHFLRSIFEGTTPDGKPGANNTNGVNFDIMDQVQGAPFLPQNMEELFVHEMAIRSDQLTGFFNYYRIDKLNWEDQIAWQNNNGSWQIDLPSLFICGQKDSYVPCQSAQGMEKYFSDLQKYEVDSGHWIQVEAREKTNEIIKNWLRFLHCH